MFQRIYDKICSNIMLILAALLTIGVRLFLLGSLNGPTIVYDEAVYWTHAANLAGLGWGGFTAKWYSYGYSLLLVPLFLFSHNMSVLYKMAICENIALSVGMLLLFIKIIDSLEIKCGRNLKIGFSFLGANCAAYIFQSQIAWSETFIYFWFTVVLLAFFAFMDRQDTVSSVLLGLAGGVLYVIHNRNIVVIVAISMTVLLAGLRRDVKLRRIIGFAAAVAAVIVINSMVKQGLTGLMWNGDMTQEFYGNDVAGNMGKLELLTTAAGIVTLLKSLGGKCWYLLCSTFMLSGWALFRLFRILITGAGDREKRSLWYKYLFVLLCIMGYVGVNTIAMATSGSGRIDVFFYGRYMEPVTGLMVILGICELFELTGVGRMAERNNRIVIKRTIAVSAVISVSALGCGVLVAQFLREHPEGVINTINVSGVYFFRYINAKYTTFFSLLVYAIIVILAFIAGSRLLREKDNTAETERSAMAQKAASLSKRIAKGMAIYVCMGMFFGIFFNAGQNILDRQAIVESESEGIDYLKAHADVPIYFTGSRSDYSVTGGLLRCYLTENEMHFEEFDAQIQNSTQDAYFVISVDGEEQLPENAQFIWGCSDWKLYSVAVAD